MTLKSFNTRYVMLISKIGVMGICLLLAIVCPLSPTRWCAEASGFNSRTPEADKSGQSLQGAAAITYLKEKSLYDSLTAGLHAARTPRGNNSPLTPPFIDEQKLTASDGAGVDLFGFSVAFSGSTIVVGAPFDSIGLNGNQGSAYVFNRQGGEWVETQKLTASDGGGGELFGFSVAFSGSTIVVGAQADNIGANLLQGSAYVFNRRGGSWVETQKLTASDATAGDQFGNVVAISGSTIVVNAIIDSVGGNFAQGSVYVFSHQGGSWVETQKLTASDGAELDSFGSSVAVNSSTIVVGAPFNDGDGIFNKGSAYVFNRQGGNWVETQKLTANDGTAGDQFGWSAAIGGSTIVVGAINDTVNGILTQGSAYVFNRQGGNWVETQKLTVSDLAETDLFGWSVAVSGPTIVVSAIFADIDGNSGQGAAYVFNRQGGSWVETLKLTASDGEAADFFGRSVAVSGSTIVVGADGDDIGGNTAQGSAYVFEP